MFLKRNGYDCIASRVEVYRNGIYTKDGNYWIKRGSLLHDMSYLYGDIGVERLYKKPVYPSKEALVAAHPMLCPEKGSFVAYKKIVHGNRLCVAKLFVPPDALRTSGYTSGGKIRVSKVLVTDIYDVNDIACKYDDGKGIFHTRSRDFYYRVGEYAFADYFDDRREMICSHGIHAFMTEDEARNYEG